MILPINKKYKTAQIISPQTHVDDANPVAECAAPADYPLAVHGIVWAPPNGSFHTNFTPQKNNHLTNPHKQLHHL